MLDSPKDCYNCFLLSLVKKHLNEHIIYNFPFLLKTVLETYLNYYTILFIAFEFIFILQQIFCLPKKPQELLF